MRTGCVATGQPLGDMHGTVEEWRYGCHIVEWQETGMVTALPNPHVRPAKVDN